MLSRFVFDRVLDWTIKRIEKLEAKDPERAKAFTEGVLKGYMKNAK